MITITHILFSLLLILGYEEHINGTAGHDPDMIYRGGRVGRIKSKGKYQWPHSFGIMTEI